MSHMLSCTIGLLGLLHQKSRAAHSLQSHGHDGSHSRLPSLAGRTNVDDEWFWSLLAVSGVLCNPDDKQVEELSMPHMIPGVGFERPFGFLYGINSRVQGAEPLTLLFQSLASRSRNALPRP
jgi:hypothetical protein